MIVGIFLRNYKVYNGINYIPITNGDNFSSFFGINGIGKSSILEALDTIFNDRTWNTCKTISINYDTNSYIVPVHLILKKEIKKYEEILEKISSYIWTIKNKNFSNDSTMKYMLDFSKHVNLLSENFLESEYYLVPVGLQEINQNPIKKRAYEKKAYFGCFQRQEDFRIAIGIEKEEEKIDSDLKRYQNYDNQIDMIFNRKSEDFLSYILNLYNYVYIPSDINIAEYTHIENENMQKLMHKNIKSEIETIIGNTLVADINRKLDKYVDTISDKLLDYKYSSSGTKNTISMANLVSIIIKNYFAVRVLYKDKISVENFSSGEKRKALFDVAYAFLSTNQKHDKKIILAIDEPELSLHISNCLDIFEKLQTISNNNQVIVTTHWYGFLQTIQKGYAINIINEKDLNGNIKKGSLGLPLGNFKKFCYMLKQSAKENDPFDIILKSKLDFVQCIASSLKDEKAYTYLFVEGPTEVLYFTRYLEYYVKNENLRIISLTGKGNVTNIMNLLYSTLDTNEIFIKGKVLALIDTDSDNIPIPSFKENENLLFRRIEYDCSKDTMETKIINTDNKLVCTSIEDTLEPSLFKETLFSIAKEDNIYEEYEYLNSIENIKSYSHSESMNLNREQREKIASFFEQSNGKERKYRFAKLYCMNKLDIRKNSFFNYVCTDLLKFDPQKQIEYLEKSLEQSPKKRIVVKRKKQI